MNSKSTVAKRPRTQLPRIALGLAVLLLAADSSFMCTMVSGTSMAPTLHNGQFTLVSNLAYLFELPKRGDLVVVWTGTELLIKRIVAVPGDTFAIRNSRAMVGGKALKEPYVKFGGHWEIAEGKIEPDKYVVVGDNRSGPQGDSLLALVKKEKILGKVIYY